MTDSRIEELERRLNELESGRAGDRARSALDIVVPTDARRHLRAAGREQLLALRAMLDFWIDQLRDGDDDAGRRETIRID
ncbi:MAG TPA: hypothetical protein VNW68_03235 [Candidatus Limnocylindria bacterium]|jgi:hypothetical protein|nr:hypothetical protein [Candidatus Limnocylindria bacterium]